MCFFKKLRTQVSAMEEKITDLYSKFDELSIKIDATMDCVSHANDSIKEVKKSIDLVSSNTENTFFVDNASITPEDMRPYVEEFFNMVGRPELVDHFIEMAYHILEGKEIDKPTKEEALEFLDKITPYVQEFANAAGNQTIFDAFDAQYRRYCEENLD